MFKPGQQVHTLSSWTACAMTKNTDVPHCVRRTTDLHSFGDGDGGVEAGGAGRTQGAGSTEADGARAVPPPELSRHRLRPAQQVPATPSMARPFPINSFRQNRLWSSKTTWFQTLLRGNHGLSFRTASAVRTETV